MKYVKVRKELAFILSPLLLLIGVLLFCFFPHLISHFFYAFWLCTACVIFLVITPYGNKRLAQNAADMAQRLRWRYWFLCILLLEITLIGVYAGIAHISGTLFPINTPVQSSLFSTTLYAELVHFGLFPWTVYALIAVGMGVLAYCEQTNAFFSNLLKPFTQQEPQETVSLIVNIGMRRFTLFSVGITFMLMTLLLVSLFLSPSKFIVHGFHPAALLMTLILLVVSFTANAKKIMNRLFSHRIPTALIFPAFIITLGFILLILSVVTTGLSKRATVETPPAIIINWVQYHWHTAWSFFSVMWWCSLTPIVAAFIIRVSKGYSIRAILMAVLALPVALCLFFIFQLNFTLFSFSSFVINILSLISFFILFPLLINHNNSSSAIVAYFPKNGVIKHRDEQPFFQRVVQIALTALYFYLVIGMNGLSLFIFAPNYFSLLTLLFSGCAIIKNTLLCKE